MANHRMMNRLVVENDKFVMLPTSTQALYFHFLINADDDGFIGNSIGIQRIIGCKDKDIKTLEENGFIIRFKSGVIVVKHWRLHNTLKKDRYTPTIYQDEFSTLAINKNKEYTLLIDCKDGNNLETIWKQNGNNLETKSFQEVSTMEPQDKTRQDKLSKVNLNSQSSGETATEIPTPLDIFNFYHDNKMAISPVKFWNYINKTKWMDKDGKRIRDWKAAYLSWRPDIDEEYNPDFEFHSVDYDYYTGDS